MPTLICQIKKNGPFHFPCLALQLFFILSKTFFFPCLRSLDMDIEHMAGHCTVFKEILALYRHVYIVYSFSTRIGTFQSNQLHFSPSQISIAQGVILLCFFSSLFPQRCFFFKWSIRINMSLKKMWQTAHCRSLSSSFSLPLEDFSFSAEVSSTLLRTVPSMARLPLASCLDMSLLDVFACKLRA